MKHLLIIPTLIFIIHSVNLFSADEHHNDVYFGANAGYNIQAKHSEFSLIVGYDRYFDGTPLFTIGFLSELIFAEHTELLFGIPIGFYPIEQIKLWIAPCYAFNISSKEHSEAHTEQLHSPYEKVDEEHIKFENNFMLKFGAGYSYHFHNTNIGILPFIEGTLISKEFIIGFGIKFNLYF